MRHYKTDEITCPYCDFEYHCSDELGDNKEFFTLECCHCGAELEVTKHLEISYSTDKIK